MTRAREDIRNCYMKLLEAYNIDENNVVIGGFSCGAIAAIDMAMIQTIPVKGFIAVSPYDIPDTLNAENIKNEYQRGVKGVVIRGKDEYPISRIMIL
jgi:predicted esterase